MVDNMRNSISVSRSHKHAYVKLLRPSLKVFYIQITALRNSPQQYTVNVI